jgi:type I restriction enzyme S subunit
MTEKQTVKFGDICREVKLTTKDPIADGYDKYIGLEHLDSGSLKIKRWGSIAEDNPSFTRVFKKGHILFGKRRSYLKKAAVAEFDGICSGDIIVMEPYGNLMPPELLPFIVQSESFWDWAIKTSSGSLSPRTRFSALSLYQIEYNNNEFSRKLSVLESVNSQILKIESLIDKVQISKNVYLSDKLWGFYKNKDYVKLGSVCLKITDGTHQKVIRDSQGSIPFLYVSCIGKGIVYWENTDRVSDEVYNEISKGREIDENVVLYSAVGSYGNAVYLAKKVKATFQRHIAYIKVDKEMASPKFLEIWLNSRFGIYHSNTLAIGNAQKTVTLGDLAKFPFPSISIEDQLNIVSIFDGFESILKTLRTKKDNLHAIQYSLLLKL